MIPMQVKQTLASLKGAQANLELFALQTLNHQSQQIYSKAAKDLEASIVSLQTKIRQIELENPHFKIL